MSATIAENVTVTDVHPYQLPVFASENLQRQVNQFLIHEAQLLDTWQVETWIKLITPDIDYRMPMRNSIDDLDLGKSFSTRAFHMIEDHASLLARMKRFSGPAAWSEKPPSRVRRHISNVTALADENNEIPVRSNLLFFWARDQQQIVMSAERRDRLRLIDGRLYLAKRLVLLDHVTLPVPNLSVVL
jgi:ethylbenzene dioxygenase beta subunit